MTTKEKILREIQRVAKRVYDELGPGHEEAIYRDAMSLELQEKGYAVKTEAPVSIKYNTSKGKSMIVGSGKIDLYVSKRDSYAVIELKTTGRLLKEDGNKTKEEKKEYIQLQKYLKALDQDCGVLINFPFPGEDEPEVII